MINYSYRIIEGDTHTPISIFLSLKGQKKFLLESSLKHEKSGRYSIIGANPFYKITATDNLVEHHDLIQDTIQKETARPFDVIENLLIKDFTSDLDVPFPAGGVGYMAYDVIRQFESIGAVQKDELNMPDIHLMFYENVMVYDHLMQKIYCFAFDRWITGEQKNLDDELNQIEKQLKGEQLEDLDDFSLSLFSSNIEQQDFESTVEQIKQHIFDGDIFQAVLSQRLSASYKGEPFSFYRKLRKSNPSPYMFFVDFHDYTVLGASPESLIKVNDSHVTTNPIAGTRKRGLTDSEDYELEQDLLNDEKEIAEHQMLVDLGRNDLGRICKPGTISLSKYMVVERYRYVMHIVSEVTGVLRDNQSPLEALKACLPAGTVSGAPKIRAMQILNELENVKRGVYSGAVGYLAINGNLDFALAIRTMVLKDQLAHVQAGAGVVYDSVPTNEFEETLNKAKALMEVNT
ncbi:anthranilate synthase component I [Filobacillus milosensis]|uniref:Anthranilate synthase component 1 n=1 Tax=Filobacillus milosensis TaxID=94137 RepID=A0A4Y8INT3_9BACI|nr:anthranilate synthase component I [Filobacillus milosensis]TFB21823.1 anthranilate synthase component I [Filobacillus milosensis]